MYHSVSPPTALHKGHSFPYHGCRYKKGDKWIKECDFVFELDLCDSRLLSFYSIVLLLPLTALNAAYHIGEAQKTILVLAFQSL